MTYEFKDLGDVSCRDIAQSIAGTLLNRVAVNTSFDSGTMSHAWMSVDGFAITPTITPQFIESWPVSHDEYCDEWWVFESDIPKDFTVEPFCNYVGMRIADYKQLDWDNGCPLDLYLSKYNPVAVFGNNENGYLILRRPSQA
ncbi:MAG TPA: hypothetical protein VNL17_06745 [Verrucomicrobiae bacterium]|nr:hypothetical protein [Verrucomicrobiae bacterium]